MEPIKILIADDHPYVREGLMSMLKREGDFVVVGEAVNGLEAVSKAREFSPDVILMDLRMPELDGVEAMNQIREINPDAKFVILTTYSDDDYIFRGIEAGARAYLLKDAPRDDLFKAIRAVYKGESLIQPVVASKVLNRLSELSRRAPSTEELSPRELDVLRLMAKGAANKEIGTELSISQSTVKTHISSIFQKLGVNDRTGAVTEALKKGIISL